MTISLKSRFLILFILVLATGVPALAEDACPDNTTCPPGVSADVIAAYPYPNVIPLEIEESVLYDRAYRSVEGEMQIFDAPNGNLIETTGDGFSYVTIYNTGVAEGWAQIAPDKWVRTDNLTEVLPSRFAGVLLPDEPLPYTMAWTMRHLRPSETPGGEQSDNNPFLYRYTRVNLYDSVEVDGLLWYQIGENQWVHQFDVAKIEPIERPADVDTEKWVGVDLYEQVAIAYEGDKPVFATLVSSGLKDWGTNEGLFHIYLRYERTPMSGAYQQPDFYYLQDVPWTMYFDDDIALHGTYWHDGFGYRHSHGCVNLSITDSHWLYEWSATEWDFTVSNDTGAAVYVYSSGTYDE